jgi:hypothetical protein
MDRGTTTDGGAAAAVIGIGISAGFIPGAVARMMEVPEPSRCDRTIA